MTTSRKLDKEHLDALQTLRESFANNASQLGSVALEQIAINRRLEYLNSEQERFYEEFEMLRKQEQELLEKMRERYGDGQINIANGTFTPDSGLAE
jgi:predicted transcriptional regulator